MARTAQTAAKSTGGKAPRVALAHKTTRQAKDARPPPKPRRLRKGTKALQEIRKYQKSVELLIPRAPFSRLVREIAQGYKIDLRFTETALMCLQEGAEVAMINMFEVTMANAVFAGRKTAMAKDIKHFIGCMRLVNANDPRVDAP